MASAATVWEFRTTGNGGNDANGGGFDPTTPSVGTDYTQQSTVQYALTGLTSSTFPTNTINCVTASVDMIGNYIQITGGTNFVVGFYRIASVVAGVSFTVDNGSAANAVITANGASGTGNIGGALTRLDKICGTTPIVSPGNICWVQTGAYTALTTALTIGADGSQSGGLVHIIGYSGTRQDTAIAEASMPVFTSVTNGIALIIINAVTRLRFKNIKGTHTAATRGIGISAQTSASADITVENCVFDGCVNSINLSSISFSLRLIGSTFRNCTSTTTGAVNATTNNSAIYVSHCAFYGNAQAGLNIGGASSILFSIRHSIFAANLIDGVKIGSENNTVTGAVYSIENCVFYGNTGAGIHFSQAVSTPVPFLIANNIFSRNTTYGILNDTNNTLDNMLQLSNSFDANTTAPRSNLPAGVGDVTLSGNPFTNATNKDFSLISTGAGLQCRAAAYPSYVGVMTVTDPTLTYRDDGAAQAQATGGGSTFRPFGDSVV
jgi:hypothetical protein